MEKGAKPATDPYAIRRLEAVATTILGGSVMGLLIVVFVPNLWRDRRIRLPLMCVVAALAGSLIEVRYYVHYAAPATAALLILAVQAFRHLRQWTPTGAEISCACHPDPGDRRRDGGAGTHDFAPAPAGKLAAT